MFKLQRWATVWLSALSTSPQSQESITTSHSPCPAPDPDADNLSYFLALCWSASTITAIGVLLVVCVCLCVAWFSPTTLHIQVTPGLGRERDSTLGGEGAARPLSLTRLSTAVGTMPRDFSFSTYKTSYCLFWSVLFTFCLQNIISAKTPLTVDFIFQQIS